jgi:hypothetical protein
LREEDSMTIDYKRIKQIAKDVVSNASSKIVNTIFVQFVDFNKLFVVFGELVVLEDGGSSKGTTRLRGASRITKEWWRLSC